MKGYQDKKRKVLEVLEEARAKGHIDEKAYQASRKSLDEDKLVIAVAGKMKAGKSTLINAMLFNRHALPTSVTPETASITRILKGDSDKIEVVLYSKSEWEAIKKESEARLKDLENDKLDFKTKREIKSLKELVDKGEQLLKEDNITLGDKNDIKTISDEKNKDDDNWGEVAKFIGEKGKYTPVTKEVRVYIKDAPGLENGVEIVDTPGTSDPVRYREARTREFLFQADIILVLYRYDRIGEQAGDDFIINTIGTRIPGALLFYANKVDEAKEGCETFKKYEEELEKYINNITKNIRNISSQVRSTKQNLAKALDGAKVGVVSGQLALLSKIKKEDMKKGDDFDDERDFECLKKNFETDSKDTLYKYSKMQKLQKTLTEIVDKEKEDILIEKPLKAIINHIETQIDEAEKNRVDIQYGIENIDEVNIDTKIDENNEKRKIIQQKSDRIIKELDERIEKLSENIKKKIEDKREEAFKKINEINDEGWEWGFLGGINEFNKEVTNKMNVIDGDIYNLAKDINNKDIEYFIDGDIGQAINKIKDIVKENIGISDIDALLQVIERKIKASLKDKREHKEYKDNSKIVMFESDKQKLVSTCKDDIKEAYQNVENMVKGIFDGIENVKKEDIEKIGDKVIKDINSNLEKLKKDKENNSNLLETKKQELTKQEKEVEKWKEIKQDYENKKQNLLNEKLI